MKTAAFSPIDKSKASHQDFLDVLYMDQGALHREGTPWFETDKSLFVLLKRSKDVARSVMAHAPGRRSGVEAMIYFYTELVWRSYLCKIGDEKEAEALWKKIRSNPEAVERASIAAGSKGFVIAY